MTLEQQQQLFTEFVANMKAVMLKKGNDYSNQDRLSNFKIAANLIGKSPEEVCLTLIAIKVARLGVLLKSDTKPENESIEDSIVDLANYNFLLSAIRNENDGKPKYKIGDVVCGKGGRVDNFPMIITSVPITKDLRYTMHCVSGTSIIAAMEDDLNPSPLQSKKQSESSKHFINCYSKETCGIPPID